MDKYWVGIWMFVVTHKKWVSGVSSKIGNAFKREPDDLIREMML